MTLAPPSAASRPLHILAVDDDTPVGRMLVLMLAQAGHTCEHVSDGLAAWDKLSADLGYFDVVLTDHEMPNLTGLELVQLLREADYRGRIIVHCSALEPQDAEGYRRFHVAAILEKPTDVREIAQAVHASRAA